MPFGHHARPAASPFAVLLYVTICISNGLAGTGLESFHLPLMNDAQGESAPLRRLLNRASILEATPEAVYWGEEDRLIEVSLPHNCSRIFWKTLRGMLYPADRTAFNDGPASAASPIISGAPFTSSDFCSLVFVPEPHFYGEQVLWYATSDEPLVAASDSEEGRSSRTRAPNQVLAQSNTNRKETLHAAIIAVAPVRDAPTGVADNVTVASNTWAVLAVLQNDVDADVPSLDQFYACCRPGRHVTPQVPGAPPSQTASTVPAAPWLDVVVITDSEEIVVTTTLTAGGASLKRTCDFSLGQQLPTAMLPRCVTQYSIPAPPGASEVLPTTGTLEVRTAVLGSLRTELYRLHHVPLNQTLFVRARPPPRGDTPPPTQPGAFSHATDPPLVTLLFANVSVPVCAILRVASVSDALHGHTVALPAPLVWDRSFATGGTTTSTCNGGSGSSSESSPPPLPGLPCFLVGATIFEEHRAYLRVDPKTGAAVFPPVDEVSRATLEATCHGPWTTGTHSPTSVFQLPGDILATVVLYHPDPGYVGADSFSYEVGDGFPGLGSKSSALVHIDVTAPTGTSVPSGSTSDSVAAGCSTWKCALQTFDGRFNSLAHPEMGSMMSPLRRVAPAAYSDGIDSPAGSTRVSTRHISNALFHQPTTDLSADQISELHVHFGQFLTHDLDFATPLADFKSESNFVIPIPRGDPWFDPEGTGNATMRFRRSGPQEGTGEGTGVPREQLNKITPWLDLNVVYGTLVGRNRALRTLSGGRLLHLIGTNATSTNARSSGSNGTVSVAVPAHPVAEPSMSGGGGYGDEDTSHGSPTRASESFESPTHLLQGHASEQCVTMAFQQDAGGAVTNVTRCKPGRGQVEHLALNHAHLPNLNLLGRARNALFVSGDNRVNVQPGLAAMHTLLAREHNTVCDELAAALLVYHDPARARQPDIAAARAPHAPAFHTPSFPPLPIQPPQLLHVPGWTITKLGIPYPVPVSYPYAFDGSPAALKHYDEQLFQSARAIVRAKWQGLVWNEYLPTVLGVEGWSKLPPYAHNEHVDARISNEFATAAFRFGHSQVSSSMHRYVPTTGCAAGVGEISLRDAYFTSMRLLAEGGVDPILAGSLLHVAQEVDTKAVDEVRNLLFATNTQGFDLIALNIQRGRDHGLPDYNTIRAAVGLPPVLTFEDISPDPHVVLTLSQLYSSVNDVDLVVGGLAEAHVPGGIVGPTFAALIADVFVRVRNGDRFWFENTHSPQYHFLTAIAPLQEYTDTRMADLLARDSTALDGRFGAEIAAWRRTTPVHAAAATGERNTNHTRRSSVERAGVYTRTSRDRIGSDIADSLCYGRQVALPSMKAACAGVAEETIAAAVFQPEVSTNAGSDGQGASDDAIDAAYGF